MPQETADGAQRLKGVAAEAPAPCVKVGPAIRWILLGILGLALLVRLLHFWSIAGTAFPKLPLVYGNSDMYANWQWAQRILAGDWLGRDTYHPYNDWMKEIAPLEVWYRWWGGKEIFQQAPLYPYFVAGLLGLFKGSVTWVMLVQLLIGVLQPLIMYQLATRLFDARAGLAAAGLTALYGPFVFHQGVLLRDWLPPLLEPLALLALLHAKEVRRWWAWVAAGCALGLALLAKETILLFLPLAGFWILLEHRTTWREVARAWIGIALGLLLFLSPIFIRNATVGAPPFALSNRTAEGFIVGNAVDAFPVGLRIPPSMAGILERSEGRLWPVILETLDAYQGDWLRFIKLEIVKLRALGNSFEVPNNVSFAYGLRLSPVLRLSLGYGFVFPLGLAGFLLLLRDWRRHSLIVLYALATMGGLMATIVTSRYRLVLVPVLILYAAALLVALWGAIQQRHMRWALAAFGLIAAAALAQQTLLLLPEEFSGRLNAAEYVLSARLYASQGQFDRAAGEWGRFLAQARQDPVQAGDVPWYETEYRQVLARHLLAQGARTEARHQVELALAGDTRTWEHDSEACYRFGQLYLLLGEPAKARPFFVRFLELEPEYPRAAELRSFLSRLGGSP